MNVLGTDLPLLVVVTGPPGAGKSTLARALATELRLPLLAKDDFKELLFRSFPADSVEASRTLGRPAYDALFHALDELLGAGVSVIAEANFSDPAPLLALPPARIAQVHLRAPVDTLLARFLARPRDPGHQTEAYADEIRARIEAGEWAPLPLPGRLFELDTSAPVDAAVLAHHLVGERRPPKLQQ